MYLKFICFITLFPFGTYCQDADVLILGAGMAGVTSASVLTQQGMNNFLILEAKDRVGGRMAEVMVGNYLVPMGAGWVQGLEGNPTYDMTLERNLTTFANDYDDWLVLDEQGNDVTLQGNLAYLQLTGAITSAFEYRKTIMNSTGSDISVNNIFKYADWIPDTALEDVCQYFEIDFDSGIPGDVSGLQYYLGTNVDPPYGEGELFVLDQEYGFSQLVTGMLEDQVPDWESKTSFNTVVESITYNDEGVTVSTNTGDYTARYAMVTFSLGVLQHQVVEFIPELPEWKRAAIFGFNFATYYHIYMRFPAEVDWFVPDQEWIVYASERRGYFPIWQNLEKHLPGCRILHGTVTYEEAERLDRMTDEEVGAEAMLVLRSLFGPDIPDVVETVMSRWLSDPYTLGSYSDWPTGYTLESHLSLQAPVGRLYFSGEVYHNDNGFVNGAYLASLRETNKLIDCMNNPENCENSSEKP